MHLFLFRELLFYVHVLGFEQFDEFTHLANSKVRIDG